MPSGNFGNVCAGHIAKMMGLPIDRLIVATNENDVLHEFFDKASYQPRPSNKTYVTSSPSMDISKASNFERFIYTLLNKDGEKVAELFTKVKQGEGFRLDEKLDEIRQDYGFISGKSTHQDRLDTIKKVYQETGRLIDPHTADGVKVAKDVQNQDEIIVVAETALPIKFAKTIKEAVGDVELPRPKHTQDLETKPQFVIVLDNDAKLVANEICRKVYAK